MTSMRPSTPCLAHSSTVAWLRHSHRSRIHRFRRRATSPRPNSTSSNCRNRESGVFVAAPWPRRCSLPLHSFGWQQDVDEFPYAPLFRPNPPRRLQPAKTAARTACCCRRQSARGQARQAPALARAPHRESRAIRAHSCGTREASAHSRMPSNAPLPQSSDEGRRLRLDGAVDGLRLAQHPAFRWCKISAAKSMPLAIGNVKVVVWTRSQPPETEQRVVA